MVGNSGKLSQRFNGKKKILFLHAGAELYGADKVLLGLVSNLNHKEYIAKVILPNKGPLVSELEKKGIETSVLEYPILRRNIFNFKGICNYIKEYFKSSRELNRIITEENFDLIHVNTAAVLEGIYLKLKNNIPLVWHIHEIIVRPKFIFRGTSLLIGLFATKIVTVSEAVKNHLISSRVVPPSKVKVVYNGIDGNKFDKHSNVYLKKELGINNNDLVVGMVGRINKWKGQKDFIVAVKPLLEKYPYVKAVMVGGVFKGEEWRLRELKKEISASGLRKKIILVDFQTNIEDYYNIMDIFVLPSTNPDPLPTVVLEAMASSKPIVGYAHGGISEMVAHPEKFLVEPRNPFELTNIIEQLILNENVSLTEGIDNKKKQIAAFDKKSYAENFEKIYNALLLHR